MSSSDVPQPKGKGKGKATKPKPAELSPGEILTALQSSMVSTNPPSVITSDYAASMQSIAPPVIPAFSNLATAGTAGVPISSAAPQSAIHCDSNPMAPSFLGN